PDVVIQIGDRRVHSNRRSVVWNRVGAVQLRERRHRRTHDGGGATERWGGPETLGALRVVRRRRTAAFAASPTTAGTTTAGGTSAPAVRRTAIHRSAES